MTAVARVLRSHWILSDWDSRRLLRFLAGLALLALAFTTPAPASADHAVAVSEVAVSESVAVREATPAPVTQSDTLALPADVRAAAAPAPSDITPVLALGSLVILLTGAAQRARGERAPPTA